MSAAPLPGLIGGEKGCFERANGGTLLLDEITEIRSEMQAKLLRVLEEKEVRRVGGVREIPIDVRVLAASNRQPRRAIREGKLREDCTSASACFHSNFRRCAIGLRMCRYWPPSSSDSSIGNTTGRLRDIRGLLEVA